MRPRCSALVLAAALGAAPSAYGWTDARPAGLVTELAVDRDGGATVTLRVRWRVLAGRFRAFDLAELPADFTLVEASGSDASGSPVTVVTRVRAPGRLEVTLGETTGLRRGAVDVVLRYTTSLRTQGAIHRVGNDAVIDVATLPWERGLEAAEVRLALPTSARRAQWLADETPGVDATVTSEPGRDVVRAMRRHLPAGTRWTARIACDPLLFAWLGRGTGAVRVASRQSGNRGGLAMLGASIAAALLGGAAYALRRRVRRDALLWPWARRSALPVALAVAGGACQSLGLLDVPGAITIGTTMAALALGSSLPRHSECVDGDDESTPARVWPRSKLEATHRRVPWWNGPQVMVASLGATTVALATASIALRQLGVGIAALDAALVTAATVGVLRRLTPVSAFLTLRPVADELERGLRQGAGGSIVWHVRDDGTGRQTVSATVAPRVGQSFTSGAIAVALRCRARRGLLRWRGTPTLTVTAAAHSDFARRIARSGLPIGTDTERTEEGAVRWSIDLVGPDRRVLGLLARALVPTSTNVPASASATATVREAIA